MSTPYVSATLRRLVVERAGNRCEYCGIPEAATFAAHELDHLNLDKARIVPLTAKGRVTIQLLQLNRPERVEERARLMDAGLYNVS